MAKIPGTSAGEELVFSQGGLSAPRGVQRLTNQGPDTVYQKATNQDQVSQIVTNQGPDNSVITNQRPDKSDINVILLS
jgi:hypothetical protein